MRRGRHQASSTTGRNPPRRHASAGWPPAPVPRLENTCSSRAGGYPPAPTREEIAQRHIKALALEIDDPVVCRDADIDVGLCRLKAARRGSTSQSDAIPTAAVRFLRPTLPTRISLQTSARRPSTSVTTRCSASFSRMQRTGFRRKRAHAKPSSSDWICWLIADCVRFSSAAASLKLVTCRCPRSP